MLPAVTDIQSQAIHVEVQECFGVQFTDGNKKSYWFM